MVAAVVAEAAGEKKARNILTLDMRDISPITDYFVICSASNTVQVRSIADHIEETLASRGLNKRHIEGAGASRWILLDYGDVVVHVFHDFEREFYNLERLWGDAQVVDL